MKTCNSYNELRKFYRTDISLYLRKIKAAILKTKNIIISAIISTSNLESTISSSFKVILGFLK